MKNDPRRVFMFHVFMFQSSTHRNLHKLRLFFPQRKMISTQTEFNRITQRCAADHLNISPVAEAHFEQSPTQFSISADADYKPAATHTQLIQAARLRRSAAVIAAG
jgi:hypothetical protein